MAIISNLDPNLTWRHYFCSLKYQLPFYWPRLKFGKHTELLKKELSEFFEGQEVVLFDSGRNSITHLLNAMKSEKPDRTEVAVLAYTCLVVVNAIRAAGLTPVFIEVNKETLNFDFANLQKKLSNKTLAVIAQNTFGIAEDMPQLSALSSEHSAYLIEDLPHTIGGAYNNKLLGTFGDAAILSFGSNKILTSSTGGAVVTKNKNLAAKLQSHEATLPTMSNWQILKHHIKVVKFHQDSKFYFYGGKIEAAINSKLGFIPKKITAFEKKGDIDQIKYYKYPNSLAELARISLSQLNKNLDHRQKIVDIYKSEFGASLRSAPLMFFPYFTKDPKQLYNRLLKKHILTSLEWSGCNIVPTDHDKSKTEYEAGSCPIAEEIASQNINLPTHIHITPKMAYKVINAIKKYEE